MQKSHILASLIAGSSRLLRLRATARNMYLAGLSKYYHRRIRTAASSSDNEAALGYEAAWVDGFRTREEKKR